MKDLMLAKMRQDMKINRYSDEKEECFIGRLLYSALCEWMRYSILDEMTENFDRKSKTYLHVRMKKILTNMIESFPESRYWFYTEKGIKIEEDELVHQLRDKMLHAGEIIEIDEKGNIALPSAKSCYCTDEYQRFIGLENNKQVLQYIGITRVLASDEKNKTELSTSTDLEIEIFLEWIFQNTIWKDSIDMKIDEFFNPYAKKPPYQSWTSSFPKGGEFTLARNKSFNESYEYYLVKRQDEKIYRAPLMNPLKEWKEERRIILALRKEAKNQIVADYTDKGDVVILNLYCGIPLKEQILLDTYCWPLNSMVDQYNYVVPKIVWDMVKSNLCKGLGIRIRKKKN